MARCPLTEAPHPRHLLVVWVGRCPASMGWEVLHPRHRTTQCPALQCSNLYHITLRPNVNKPCLVASQNRCTA